MLLGCQCNRDEIEIEEYNYGIRESYNKRIVKANTMTGFIHFKDLAGGSVGNSQSSASTGGTHFFSSLRLLSKISL